MHRHAAKPREDWRRRVEEVGLTYPTTRLPDGSELPYWDETAFYELSEAEVDELEATTERLYGMCLEAAKHLASGAMGPIGLPEWVFPHLRVSLEAEPPSVYARFDLRYDGLGPAKMLEINGDTPTGLLEASVVQWHWAREVMPSCDQWNSIHERLVATWRAQRDRLGSRVVHFAHHGGQDTTEEWMTVAYLRDTADQAGYDTRGITIEEIAWDFGHRRFLDPTGTRIDTCFKLYPWEDMLADEFGRYALEQGHTAWVEPLWKVLLSTKALLAALWYLYPGHDNLLPTFLDGPQYLSSYVVKPFFGREGEGIRVVVPDRSYEPPAAPRVPTAAYQQWAELPVYDGNYAVLGTWVVGGRAAGLGVRESDGPITDGRARFVPHVISAPVPDPATQQRWLAEDGVSR